MTVWYAGWNGIPPSIPDKIVVSPEDGHIVARNMQRLINILRINILRINILRKNCAPSWLYLQQ
jgi:hypothetical protein